MADQLTTASKLRFKGRLDSLSEVEMAAVERAIKVQLGMRA